jgi:hypothetical protein
MSITLKGNTDITTGKDGKHQRKKSKNTKTG